MGQDDGKAGPQQNNTNSNSMSYLVRGIDVSAWQGSIYWPAVGLCGQVKFVYAKATEGTKSSDTQFLANHFGCKMERIPFGAYHFFRFDQDAAEQANNFLAVAGPYLGQLRPMVDVEAGSLGGGTYSIGDKINALGTFLNIVEKAEKGKQCLIYSSYGEWNGVMEGTDSFSGHPFWVAEYNDQKDPSLPSGVKDWTIWQYSSGGNIPGISGHVDLDRLNGTDLKGITRQGVIL